MQDEGSLDSPASGASAYWLSHMKQ